MPDTNRFLVEPKQICLYSGWGIGKTSLLYDLAKFLWVEKGLRTLVYTSDTGGAGPLAAGVSAGAIEVVYTDLYTKNQFNMMDLVVQGFAPPEKGAPLKAWKKVDFKKEGYGAVCIEGLTSWGQGIMRWAGDKHAQGVQIGMMKTGEGMLFKDGEDEKGGGGSKYGLNTQVHYGIAQQELARKVAEAKKLWSELDLVVWTALETKVELKKDQNLGLDGKPMAYGPMMPGQAATAQCGSWFTDVLHLDVVDPKKQPDGTILGERKLFLGPHYGAGDPTPYFAKVSVSPDGKMPSCINPSFATYFSELDKALKKASEGWKRGGV